ncbi:MAG: PDZ domain-containing protein [Planctomycetaceae bacterium]|nr:PDZ domain-containing protein [Planctomycetaceae bacterium]
MKALRARFECVRVTQMNGVDIARFEFDYDTTWAAFFLDADLNVYSRYGGRDSDSAEGRMSIESLAATMTEVLEVHERQKGHAPADAANWQPVAQESTTPEAIPLLAQSHQGCIHCHQIQEYRLLQAFHDKQFQRNLLFGYPLPENIGLRFDRAHGHKIESLDEALPVARTGLKAGDVITRVGDVPIHSEMDLRWALHRHDDRRPLKVQAQRRVAGRTNPPPSIEVEISLPESWRQTDLSWRKSLRSVPFPLGFLGYALGREERAKADLPENVLAIRVVSIRGAGLAEAVGLRKGDVITALADRRQSRTFDQFKSDLLRDHAPGDRVRLKVLREGRGQSLEGAFPDWLTTDIAVP